MNEPEVCLFGRDEEIDFAPVQSFYKAMHEVLVDAAPDLPTTIGSTRLENFKEADIDTGMALDIVTFHSFNDAETLRIAFAEANSYAGDDRRRPVTCSSGAPTPAKPMRRSSSFTRRCFRSPSEWCCLADRAPADRVLQRLDGSTPISQRDVRPAAVYLRDTMRSVALS